MPKNLTRADLERSRAHWSEDFKRRNPALVTGTPLHSAPCAAPKPISAPLPPKSPLAVKFEEIWERLGGPTLEPEHRFCKDRKWRFDYALPRYVVAIELEGGIHKRQGHASPKGYISDCRKYNQAAADGWILFRLSSGMMSDADVGQVLAGVLRRVKIIRALEDIC